MQLKLGFKDIATQMNQKFDEQKTQMEKHTQTFLKMFEVRVEQMVNDVRNDLSTDLTNLKSNVEVCQQSAKRINEVTCNKLDGLVAHNNVLERRLNRSNILIKGLNKGIKNLRKPVLKIASICNVSIQHTDVQHCCYIGNGEVVLVKFNSIYLRDTIMANYFKIKSILLKDVIGEDDDTNNKAVDGNDDRVAGGKGAGGKGAGGKGAGGNGVGGTKGNDRGKNGNDGADIEKRVFLNDHLTPSASKLVYLCRDLKRKGRIVKFTHINTDIPKVKITFKDESVKFWNIEQLTAFLNELNDANTPLIAGNE